MNARRVIILLALACALALLAIPLSLLISDVLEPYERETPEDYPPTTEKS